MNIVLIAAGGRHNDSPGGAYKLKTDFARCLAARGRRVAYLCPSWLVDHGNPELCDGARAFQWATTQFDWSVVVHSLSTRIGDYKQVSGDTDRPLASDHACSTAGGGEFKR
jgi:hypothetical protein